MRFVILPALLMGLALSGCVSLNSSFDCPMKPGVHCKRIDQIDHMVDQGQLSGPGIKEARVDIQDSNAIPTPYPMTAIHPGDPLRVQETVMRIWIAPYQDKVGNYYQPSYIYHVVKPGEWMGHPPVMLTEEETP